MRKRGFNNTYDANVNIDFYVKSRVSALISPFKMWEISVKNTYDAGVNTGIYITGQFSY